MNSWTKRLAHLRSQDGPLERTDGYEWLRRMYSMAELVGSWSKDPDTRVGAAVFDWDHRVVAVGYNGFPRGVPDFPSYLGDPDVRVAFMDHAEANALDMVDSHRGPYRMAVTKAPCLACTRRLLAKNVAELVCPAPDGMSKWSEEQEAATALMGARGVAVYRWPLS